MSPEWEIVQVEHLPLGQKHVEHAGDGALVSGQRHSSLNPAIAYLLSLQSQLSRRTMKSLLNRVAFMIAKSNIQDFDWASMRRHHVQGILSLLSSAELAPATINTYLAALKGVALEAWALKLIDSETFQQIKQVKAVRGSRIPQGRALSVQEFQALYAACEATSTSTGLRDAAIIAVLAGCGLRRSEIVDLDIEHIDVNDQSMRVLGKGNKERRAFIPQSVWVRLQRWLRELKHGSGPLFRRIRRESMLTNERMSSQAVYHILEVRQLQAGVEKFAPHDLRRTFATMLLTNGEDIITVKDAMGHANVATTQRYDRRGDERLRLASSRIIV